VSTLVPRKASNTTGTNCGNAATERSLYLAATRQASRTSAYPAVFCSASE
jgi:hypothetical protein